MKKNITVFFLLPILTLQVFAQNPKWFKKARKAQLSIVTFDAGGNISGSGNGFFIDENGTALANYDMFKHAASAKITGTDGKEYEADVIAGASSLYDIVKFRVKTDKKTPFLRIADRIGVNHEHVYIMPYPTKEKETCMSDTLKEVQKFNESYGYYTLAKRTDGQYVNCPVMSEEGEVLGMIQKNAGSNASSSYAISTAYGKNLAVSGMSATDDDLNAIGIRKALPQNEPDAQTYLFMIASRTDSVLYNKYLDDYVGLFPTSHNGFVQRADFYMVHGNYGAAEQDVEEALSVALQKDEVYYSFGKMIYELNLRQDYRTYKDWDLSKALSLCETAYTLNPLPLYIQQQGNILYALKEYGKAYEKFISLKETNMRSANIFLYAAQCQRMAEADTSSILALQDSAVACFDKPYPKDAAPAFLERANTKLSMGMYREAVLDLNEYEHLMRNEVNALFYYRREQAEMQCRMFQQAMDDIDRAIRMQSDEPLFHAERAVICYRIGETDEAIRSARKSVELDERFTDGYRILGICLIEKGQKEEGRRYLKQAADMGDESSKEILAREQE